MLARIIIVIAFFSFLNDARAQFLSPGAIPGTFGGMPLGSLTAQQCPYPFQMAPQLQMNPEQQRIAALRDADRIERQDLKAIDADMAKLKGEIRKAERGLRGRLTAEAARIVLKHMRQRGDGADLVVCNEPSAPYPGRPAEPDYGPCGPLTASPPAAATPPEPQQETQPSDAVPEGQRDQDVPARHPGKGASNRPLYCNRMPAQETPKTAAPAASTVAAPSAPVPTVKDQSLADQGQPHPTESDAGAPQAPVQTAPSEVYDPPTAHYSRGSVFCVRGVNKWEQYALADGAIDPSICEEEVGFDRNHIAGIQRPGRTYENVAACEDSLDHLTELYGKLADLEQDRAIHKGNSDQFETEASPLWHRGEGLANSGLHGAVHPFIAPLSMVEQRMGYPYPFRPSTPFAFANYGSGGYGFPNTYNGYYGNGPGSIGQGGFGCNGMQNPLLQNPFLNSMMQPWSNGIGPWPQVRPFPTLGNPAVRPFPYNMARMPGMPGQPLVRPFPSALGQPGAPGTLPLAGTLGGQVGMLNNGLGGFGAGVLPVPGLVSGSFYGGGLPVNYAPYQTSYLNTPSLGGGLAPSKIKPFVP